MFLHTDSMLGVGPSWSTGELVVSTLGEGAPKGGGHIGEDIFRARLSRQVLIMTENILQNGTIIQKKIARVIRSVVIKEKGSLLLGAVSTES